MAPPITPKSNMSVGGKQYSEGDMLRMQHEAELRVREMQQRARRTLADSNKHVDSESDVDNRPQNRNWDTSPNVNSSSRQRNNSPHRRPHNPPPEIKTEPVEEIVEEQQFEQPVEAIAPPKKSGTIVGDIMGALNLDEDYLLIIGLLLILINQRADTTLILALVYLLI